MAGEQALHAEGAGLVRHDRHDVLAQVRVAQQPAQHVHEDHRGRGGVLAAALGVGRDEVLAGGLELRGADDAGRQRSAQGLAARPQVFHLRAVVGRLVEAQLDHLVVGQRQGEAGPELADRLALELLDLVGHVPPLGRLAQAVALDRLGQGARRA